VKRLYCAVIISFWFGCSMAVAMSPFSDTDVEIGRVGIVEVSPVASEYIDVSDSESSSPEISNLKKAVDRYLYLIELLKRNPEIAPAYADQMARLEKKIVDGIARQVDAGIHLIAGRQLHGAPLDENSPECVRNRELLALHSRVAGASAEFESLLQSDVQTRSFAPINQADADYIANQQKKESDSAEKQRVINEIRYALSRLRDKNHAGASSEDLILTLNWLKRWFSKAESENVEIPSHLRSEYEKLLIATQQQIADQQKEADPENILNEFVYGTKMLEQRISDGESPQQINATLNWTTERLNRARAAGLEIPNHLLQYFEELRKKVPAVQDGVVISEKGKQQMNAVVEFARRNHRGYSGGDCFEYVWRYLHSSGYGNISRHGDLPRMQSDWARHFSDFLNASPANLREAGLQRLDTAYKPPITNPHDPRIPRGAVIVVAPGSYGTAHRYAGDIVIKAGDGHFINDGPNMDYGTRASWHGKVLGVYVPE